MPRSIGIKTPNKTHWRVKSSDKGFDLFNVTFVEVNDTLTRVLFKPRPDADLDDIKSQLSASGENVNEIPIVKVKGVSGSSRRLAVDLDSPEISFEIDHESILEEGIEFKIGLNSTTIETVTTPGSIYAAGKTNAYFAQTRYWVFYHTGTKPVYKSATTLPGLNAAVENDIFSTAVPTIADWAIQTDGDNIIALFANNFSAKGYRNGVFTAGGTITWNALDFDFGGGAIKGQINVTFRDPGTSFLMVGSVTGLISIFSSREATPLNSPVFGGQRDSKAFAGGAYDSDTLRDVLIPFDISMLEAPGDVYVIAWGGADVGVTDPKDLTVSGIIWDDSANKWLGGIDEITDEPGGLPDIQDGVSGQLELDAVQDTNGHIHVVYLTVGNALKHKEVTPSMATTTITTIDADITGLTSHTRFGLAANGLELVLVYDKGDQKLYSRIYDGTTWGTETADVKTNTNVIQGAVSCSNTVNQEVLVMWVEDNAGINEVVIQSISVAVTTGVTVTPAPVTANLFPTIPTVIPGAVTLTPSPVISVVVAPAPTVTASVTLTPSPVVSVSVIPAPSVAQGAITLTPSPVAIVSAIPAPTVIPGAVVLNPAPVVSVSVIPAPVVDSAVVLTPSPVTSLGVVSAPSVSVGAVTLNPTPVITVAVIPSPAVSVGTVTLTPSSVVTTMALPIPVVIPGAVTLTPLSVVGVFTLPIPVVVGSGVVINPSPLVVVSSIPPPTLSVGAVSVLPDPVTVVSSIPVPFVSDGGAVPSPSRSRTGYHGALSVRRVLRVR